MKKTNLMILSLGLLFLMSLTPVMGAVEVNILYSCPSPDPVIDGWFYSSAAEWLLGESIDVTLYEINNQADKLDIQIMSVQGNDYFIYFGVTIPNTVIEGDILYLVFRDVEGQPICVPPHKWDGNYGKDHDVIAMYMHNNHTVDMFTKDAIHYVYGADTDNGGTNDGIGKCHLNGTHVTVETKKAFNTGDTLGFDFNLVVNGTIQMFIWFFDGDLSKQYSMIREADNDYDYLTLKVQCTPAAPVPFGVIITGLFVTATIPFVIKKRRK
ncbi:MAG: hypothetical protein KGD59_10960 [Candidatus Heimdallarchaeota archaeon]|nr:hypothetical protein [Candidatus Heimdallarchaeota archaeon]MBY8995060.1 hypothetical protein [Candidatus Heimdallarchaeota archaeon]